jgi:glycine/D-amino acid oxidase-like deaminating enzyme
MVYDGSGDPRVKSWWLEQALAGEADADRLVGDTRADVCIVGGGFTGLWTALRLKELDPAVDVAILEANVCGSGASGRNGGFVMSFWHHFPSLERICGSEEGLRLAKLSVANIAEIGQFCDEHGIDAEFRQDGWLWAAVNGAQLGSWDSTVAAAAGLGERPFETLDAGQAAARSGSAKHIGGAFEASSATVQPAKLVRGLRRVALERGVRIYEHSPMVSLGRSRPLVVKTPAGTVTAEKVVLALYSWSGVVRELRRSSVVIASDIVITEPALDQLDTAGWRDGMSISDSRLLIHYYRTTPEGRVTFGKSATRLGFGGRADFQPDPAAGLQLIQLLRGSYPSLGGVPIAGHWSGPVDRTADGMPVFTTLGRPDLICGIGFSGNGVGPTRLGGYVLASMALERSDEWSGCGLVRPLPGRFPIEPVRWLGGMLVKSAIGRKEGAEDAGRRPRLIDRSLARLAPPGLVPLD